MSLRYLDIVAEACSIAKCPGYLTQGGRYLNLVLDDLVLHRNLKQNLVTTTITVTPYSNGPFNLAADYLRTYDLFYLVAQEPYFLEECTLKEYDQESKQSGTTNYPYEWASDLSVSPGQLYIYPQVVQPTTLTHRYYLRQAQVASPESSTAVPWFTDQDYLIVSTAAKLMRITDDERQLLFEANAEKMLKLHLIMEGDEQSVVKSVELDPRRFRVGSSLKPTKDNPW